MFLEHESLGSVPQLAARIRKLDAALTAGGDTVPRSILTMTFMKCLDDRYDYLKSDFKLNPSVYLSLSINKLEEKVVAWAVAEKILGSSIQGSASAVASGSGAKNPSPPARRRRLLLLQLIRQAALRPSLAGNQLVHVNAVARTILLLNVTSICLLDSVLSTILLRRRRRSGVLRLRQVILVDPRGRRGNPSPLLRRVWPPNLLPLQHRVRLQSVVLHMLRRPISSHL